MCVRLKVDRLAGTSSEGTGECVLFFKMSDILFIYSIKLLDVAFIQQCG